ncbi:MAG: M24 family metallopeptidase [Oscillospiraceae bacterium]
MVEQRAKRLISNLGSSFEAALIQTPPNRFYLLDYDSDDAGMLLVLPHKMIYIIDSRYIEIAGKSVKHAEVVLEEDVLSQIKEFLAKEGVKTLMVENAISVALLGRLAEKLESIELDSSPRLSKELNALRAIKDEIEVERMKEAQKITDACFTHILGYIREGMTEIEIMLEMEFYMRRNGSLTLAFNTICAAGTNGSMPHAIPGENKIKLGDFITMDFGAKVGGYCADMTRTVAFGQPSQEQKDVYDLVLRAHLAGLEAVRAGRICNEVDAVARDMIYDAGYKGYFGHGLGHSVGIEIHEDPRFSPKDTSKTQAGMMITVEPGIYLPGRFGVRIEDTVLITETGCQPLPASNKQLIVL